MDTLVWKIIFYCSPKNQSFIEDIGCVENQEETGLFRMALPYETMNREARAAERARRVQRMENWPRAEPTERLLTRLGKALLKIQDFTEDVLVALEEQTPETAAETKTTVVGVLRSQARMVMESIKFAEVDCRYGIGTSEQMYEQDVEVANMSEEEAKVLKAILKERADNMVPNGGGEGRGRQASAKPHNRTSGTMGAGYGGAYGGNFSGGQ